MKRELKGSSGGNLGDAREGIARPIPMKRELKVYLFVITNLLKSIARPIPMKRELKGFIDEVCEVCATIARPIPMKRELKAAH